MSNEEIKIKRRMTFEDENEEYRQFVEKFKPKKTTDDCYTPPAIYNAVADWVANEYQVSRENFVRPFYPGGDYERYPYKESDIVVDNPPFSIMSPICRFYEENGIRYFLFAPGLTCFSITAAKCHVLADIQIVYENNAKVRTSFVTNMDECEIRTAPTLHKAIKTAMNELKAEKPQLPKYRYPDCVALNTEIGRLSAYGIDFRVKPGETAFIRSLDNQRAIGKEIFGGVIC